MNSPAALAQMRHLATSGLGAPLLLLLMLGMMVVPLPPFGLDILFSFNISLSIVVLMASIYTRRPLEFASFPTVLLIATLLRLALNVASTRIVLLEGHTGTDAAGRVIEAFGAFVIGGSYAVGLVVFAILVIINFVVVTKGAGRISEVSARFTLDAMPGKQMAIDADLNAGIIDHDEARRRRREVAEEADFYGSMDGAAKFVRGDAIAGILILVVNIIGGLAIGTLQHDLPFEQAVTNYTLLTIGDGLVAQIPSLLLSTASAIMVTRVSAEQDMGDQILGHLFKDPRNLAVTAGILGLMGVLPGMPNVAFLTLGAVCGAGAWMLLRRRSDERRALEAPPPEPTGPAPLPELGWDDVVQVDPLGLEVGYRLIPLVDRAQGGELMARIKGVRKTLSQDLGFLIPAVHIRDNLKLPAGGYRISLLGVTMAEGTVHPDRDLALNPGNVAGKLPGEAVRDPVFGLDAVWTERGAREQAQALGYTVVDAGTVIATHLSHVLGQHAHLLLGHQEVQQLLDRMTRSAPKLVEDLVPKALPLGTVVRVLQGLLREQVPVRDLRTILETLATAAASAVAGRTQDPDALLAMVRVRLGRFIVQAINGLKDELPVISLDPRLDQVLHQVLQPTGGAAGGLEPGLAERMHQALTEAVQRQDARGEPAVLLVADGLRPLLARLTRDALPALRVLAYGELPDDCKVRVVASVGTDIAQRSSAA